MTDQRPGPTPDRLRELIEEWSEEADPTDGKENGQIEVFKGCLHRIEWLQEKLEELQRRLDRQVADLDAWWWVEGDLKRCPRCGEIALEGESECSNCGLEPEDDTSWREARRQAMERVAAAHEEEADSR